MLRTIPSTVFTQNNAKAFISLSKFKGEVLIWATAFISACPSQVTVIVTWQMEVYEKESVVRGHHVYKAVWTPCNGEILALEPERTNEHDQYAVAVLKDNSHVYVVGHVP